MIRKALAVAVVLALGNLHSACGVGTIRILGGSTLKMAGALQGANIEVGESAGLAGSGTIYGNVSIEGTVSPGLSIADIGLLSVNGLLGFGPGSVFQCQAATHTSLDRVECSGGVTGQCLVVMSRDPGAAPLDEVILSGDGSSNFSLFTVSSPSEWKLRDMGHQLLARDIVTDVDADGIPDFWEWIYYGNRTACDAAGHDDSDGIPNSDEWLSNTSPDDGQEYLRLTELRPAGDGQWDVSWMSAGDRSYRIERATDPFLGDWGLVDGAIGTWPPTNTYRDTPGYGGPFYYRVQAQRP